MTTLVSYARRNVSPHVTIIRTNRHITRRVTAVDRTLRRKLQRLLIVRRTRCDTHSATQRLKSSR